MWRNRSRSITFTTLFRPVAYLWVFVSLECTSLSLSMPSWGSVLNRSPPLLLLLLLRPRDWPQLSACHAQLPHLWAPPPFTTAAHLSAASIARALSADHKNPRRNRNSILANADDTPRIPAFNPSATKARGSPKGIWKIKVVNYFICPPKIYIFGQSEVYVIFPERKTFIVQFFSCLFSVLWFIFKNKFQYSMF